MKKYIFIINGAAGVGKDAFVDYIKLAARGKIGEIVNYSSVDYIKEVAKKLGWDGGRSEKDRKFLSDLKRLCTEYNDLPNTILLHKVSDFLKNINVSVLFLHIREPKEIERAKVAFGAKTILVKRDGVNPVKSNESDANVFNYTYDIEINNNGTLEDLNNLAKHFLKYLDLEDSDLNPKYYA